MAKKDKISGAPATETMAGAAVDASAATAAPAAKTVGVRGPKGVELTAKITVLAATNPKREGSKAHAVFSKYVDGMTVQEFLDAAGEEATPNIVYDTKHGFIAVEGYKVEVLPPKEPKAPKAPKEPKAKKEVIAKPAVDEALKDEIVDEAA